MSRRLSMLLVVCMVSACATGSRRHDAAYSLVGTWAYAEPQTGPRPIELCETDFGVQYKTDGTFSGYEEAGRWRIEGGHLVETITRTWEMGGGAKAEPVAKPRSHRIKLQWISPDVVNLMGLDGADGYGLVRCRSSQ